MALYALPYAVPFSSGAYGLQALAPTAVAYRQAGAGMVPIAENTLAVFAAVYIPGIRMLVSAPPRPPGLLAVAPLAIEAPPAVAPLAIEAPPAVAPSPRRPR